MADGYANNDYDVITRSCKKGRAVAQDHLTSQSAAAGVELRWVGVACPGKEGGTGRQIGRTKTSKSLSCLSGDLHSRSDPEDEELFGQVLNRGA